MLTFYYSPGACSMASHIALEETGARYEAQRIMLAKGEQKTDAYRKINPRGRVPALRTDDGVLTENLAILTYVAKRFPAAKLLPSDPQAEARCLSIMAFFASSVHIAFAHFRRPERYAPDVTAHPQITETGRKTFEGHLAEIDGMLTGKEWLTDDYTVCDPYALVFYIWGKRIDLPVKDLKAYTAHADRMFQRPAVRRALEQEGIAIGA